MNFNFSMGEGTLQGGSPLGLGSRVLPKYPKVTFGNATYKRVIRYRLFPVVDHDCKLFIIYYGS